MSNYYKHYYKDSMECLFLAIIVQAVLEPIIAETVKKVYRKIKQINISFAHEEYRNL